MQLYLYFIIFKSLHIHILFKHDGIRNSGVKVYVRGRLQRTSAKISDFQTTPPPLVRVCPNFQNHPPPRTSASGFINFYTCKYKYKLLSGGQLSGVNCPGVKSTPPCRILLIRGIRKLPRTIDPGQFTPVSNFCF